MRSLELMFQVLGLIKQGSEIMNPENEPYNINHYLFDIDSKL